MATVESKACSRCKQILPASAFRPTPTISTGLDSACRRCLAAAAKAKRHADIEAFRAWQREYYAKNSERLREHGRVNYVKHKERFNACAKAHYRANRAKYIALARENCLANPERVKLTQRGVQGRRRAITKAGVSPAAQAEWTKKQKKVCHWCGTGCAKSYHIDHIEPLSKGGVHELRNLCIACPQCNLRKSAKDPIEFARELGKLL